MRGLAVIGTASASGEAAVAAALIGALREQRPAAFAAAPAGSHAREDIASLAEAVGVEPSRLAPVTLEHDATPYVAARHAGVELDPSALATAARSAGEDAGALIVATSGGLLAPLARRFTVRDFVRELELPIVVAARAGADVVNGSLLTLEAARGAGLRPVAVVIAEWPAAPPRVLLDETALLREQAAVPVETLGDGTDPARWSVSAWLDIATAQAPAAPPSVTLEPYGAWEPRPVGDPRETPRAQIMSTLLEIVAAEGPMRASRAYALYNRAAGGRKLTSVARAPLSSALYWLARERAVVLTRAEDIPWQGDDLVRMPDSPAVRVRELGPRSLEEVPLDEVADLLRRLGGAASDPDALKRATLNAYGLVRLTARANEYLDLAIGLNA